MSTKTNDASVAVLALIGIVTGFPLLVALSSILNGYVLTILWRWFVIPFGLPSLSIVAAIGVSLVVGFLTHQWPPDVEEVERTLGERLMRAVGLCVLKPLFYLLIGWVIHLFA